ncbi:ABC transporter permease [uncultured Jatrophihabitans sp.]|uniref:ABC transporter permease n=1 Tax=uncultured Jatrophihabitans sp. TaxID=1610747 RepID=UPI0035CCA687
MVLAQGVDQFQAPLTDGAVRLSMRQRHSLGFYIGRRAAVGVVTVFATSVLIYVAIIALPGNVVEAVLGRSATAKQTADIERQLSGGLPLWERYFKFLGNLLTGHLGNSTAALVQGNKVPVSDTVIPALEHSAVLALITLIIFVPIMIALGLLAGLKPGSPRDSAITTGALAVGALPEFFIGTVLIAVFFDQFNLLPPVSVISQGASVLSSPKGLVLPVATLLLTSVGFGSRLLRASVAEIVSQDYVTMARINGYSERAIILKYVLPNALAPTVQIVAQQLQYLIGGIIVVESVFSFPGIGNDLVRAISSQDTQQILVIATILAAVYIFINLVADVICVFLDPKVRTSFA